MLGIQKMNRYTFHTTFGCRQSDNGEWVKYEEIQPYIEYQNQTVQNLREARRQASKNADALLHQPDRKPAEVG